MKEDSSVKEQLLEYGRWRERVQLLASGKAPEGLTIEQDLSLAGIRLRSLPARLTVTGDLDLRQCQRLSKIGDGLKVGGHLWIGGRAESLPAFQGKLAQDPDAPASLRRLSREGQLPLRELPEVLEVGGDLVIRSARRLQRLPRRLKVKGSLVLNGCRALEALPDELELAGDLVIIGSPKLRTLPQKIEAQSLFVKGCGIERLPEQLVISETLHLECCRQLTALPNSLTCLSSQRFDRAQSEQQPTAQPDSLASLANGLLKRIIFHACPNLEVPEMLFACSTVRLCKHPLKILSSRIQARHIFVERCYQLEEVNGVLKAEGFLSFAHCRKLSCIGPDVTCEAPTWMYTLVGRLLLENTNLRELPEALQQCELQWQGYLIPAEAVFYPERLEPGRILHTANAELRRLMLERVGLDKVLQQAESTLIDSDRDSGGARSLISVPRENRFGREARFLRCHDPSTGREYLLSVSPDCNTCREAAAWLAGFNDPDDYDPVLET